MKKVQNARTCPFTRILHGLSAVYHKNSRESANLVLTDFSLVLVSIQNLDGGGGAILQCDGGRRQQFLEFGGGRLAMTTPIRFADHHRLRGATFKALTGWIANKKTDDYKNENEYTKNGNGLRHVYSIGGIFRGIDRRAW